MYTIETPKGYPLICQIRKRSPGEPDQISTTAKNANGEFIFRPITEDEKHLEKIAQENFYNK